MKRMKRIAVALCAAVLTVSASPVYAMQSANASIVATEEGVLSSKSYDELTSVQQAQLRSKLRSLGLTDQDIAEVIQVEREHYHPNRGISFFRRPRMGETRNRTLKVPGFIVQAVREGGNAALIKFMTSKGINAVAAAMIASTINPIPANAKGMVINFSETYGYTNDGVLGWSLGPISARFTY